jgi:hypothetical protein
MLRAWGLRASMTCKHAGRISSRQSHLRQQKACRDQPGVSKSRSILADCPPGSAFEGNDLNLPTSPVLARFSSDGYYRRLLLTTIFNTFGKTIMGVDVSRPALLGVVRPIPRLPEGDPAGSYDARFRRVLKEHFDSNRVNALKRAYREMISLEQLVASQITNMIMDKVDAEYL